MRMDYFPLIAMIASTTIIITGVFTKNKDAIIAGTTISGIAGTAYQSKQETGDERNLQTKVRKNKRTPSNMEGVIIE